MLLLLCCEWSVTDGLFSCLSDLEGRLDCRQVHPHLRPSILTMLRSQHCDFHDGETSISTIPSKPRDPK